MLVSAVLIPTVLIPTVLVCSVMVRCAVVVIMCISVSMSIRMGIRIGIGSPNIEPLTSVDSVCITQMVDMQQIMHRQAIAMCNTGKGITSGYSVIDVVYVGKINMVSMMCVVSMMRVVCLMHVVSLMSVVSMMPIIWVVVFAMRAVMQRCL